jgi:UDP-N-acetylmuramoyl-tripeptide--D-alanyl-D-alanine ligase
MIPTSLLQVARAVGGELHGPQDVEIHGAAADSRLITDRDLFAAIAGDRVDGHQYVDMAMRSGAAAVLAERSVDAPHVLVDNTVRALGDLARYALTQLPETKVVAVTGSSGKTSTKDLMAAVFAHLGPVVAPAGSFNTEVGMPLTVLAADSATRTLVLEMGSRGIGHIEYLCNIAQPRISVVLNVGSAHVGEFGGQAQIARAKSEIVTALEAGGVAVLNADDQLVASMPVASGVQRMTFGESRDADVRVSEVTLDDLARPSFQLQYLGDEAPVQLRLSGEHNAMNAAAVAAVALSLGMDLSTVAASLSTADPRSPWRMEVSTSPSGITVVNDAYNANPESVVAALKALAEMGRSRQSRCWAVLGEMRELGSESLAAHDSIGRLVVRLNVSKLVAVGEGARPIHLGASQEGSWSDESVWVPDASVAVALLEKEVAPGDVVLVKASRGVGLESVAQALLNDGQVT